MKKYRLIVITALFLSLALLSFIYFYSSKQVQEQKTYEPESENMTFFGTQQGSYQYSTACQADDGTIMIASVLTPDSGKTDKVSIIKLSANGDFLWEKAFDLKEKSWLDFLKRDKDLPLRTLQISFYQNQYYVVLTQTDKLSSRQELPFILQISPDGDLLASKPVELILLKGSSVQSCLNGDKLYLSYIDQNDKALFLSRIDLLTAEVLQTYVSFIRQKNLVINAVAADPADSVISVVAYDKEYGCSFFRYTPQTDLKELFRTQINTDIKVLKYYNGRLYGAVKEASLLEVIDLTNQAKPLIKVTDNSFANDFRLIDMTIVNGYFTVLVKTGLDNPDKADKIEALLLTYNMDGQRVVALTYHSNDYDSEKQILAVLANPIFILGESSDISDSGKSRLFIKK